MSGLVLEAAASSAAAFSPLPMPWSAVAVAKSKVMSKKHEMMKCKVVLIGECIAKIMAAKSKLASVTAPSI